MDTAKIYKDFNGIERTIHQMVRREPEWAASRIQAGENALALIAKIKEFDIAQYTKNGAFLLPEFLRKKIQNLDA